jgi:hypothetical protein
MSGDWRRLHRVRGVCGGLPQNRQVTWLNHKTKTGGSAGGDGIRACCEASKRRTRVGIARLASRLSKFAVAGHPSDGAMTEIS